MFRFRMQTILPNGSHNPLNLYPTTLFVLESRKSTRRRYEDCAAFPGKGFLVNTRLLNWILFCIFGCVLTLGTTVWAEEDKLLDLCNQGNSTACFERGKKYLSLDKDNNRAIEVFRIGCEKDHMLACLWGGNLIQNKGKQYSPEWKEAAQMFKKACDAKEDAACFNLGALYYKEGRASKAKTLFQVACDMGNKPGCENVEWLSK